MHCRGLQKFKIAEGKVEKLRVGAVFSDLYPRAV
jgi:hypothetical protein